MKIDFILIATGHMNKPRINHTFLNNDDIEEVKVRANEVAVQLEKAGYFVFDLYDVRTDGAHVRIGSIKVETVEAIATFKGE